LSSWMKVFRGGNLDAGSSSTSGDASLSVDGDGVDGERPVAGSR
jgi:hypothetical protein